MATKITNLLIIFVVAFVFLVLGYFLGWRQQDLSSKSPEKLIYAQTSNPLFQERTASIPDARIVSITKDQVRLSDAKNHQATFPLSPNARVINLKATGAGSTPSADLSVIQPGLHTQVVLRFVGSGYRVEQFFLEQQ